MSFKVKLLSKKSIAPTKGTEDSAGWDLYATEDILLIPGATGVVGTGIAVQIPHGWCGLLTHRSSLGFRLDTIASFGIVDADFRGEVKVKLFNLGESGVHIKKGDRFAQLVVVPVMCDPFYIVEDLEDTSRGSGGYGSTGV